MSKIYRCQDEECGWFGVEIFNNGVALSCPECRSPVEETTPSQIPMVGITDYKEFGEFGFEMWEDGDLVISDAKEQEDLVNITIDELENFVTQFKKYMTRRKAYQEYCVES